MIVLGCYCSERVQMFMLVIANLIMLFLNNSGDSSCKGEERTCVSLFSQHSVVCSSCFQQVTKPAHRNQLWGSWFGVVLFITAEVSQEVGEILIGRSFSLLSLLGIWGIQWKFSTFCFQGFFHQFSKKNVFYLVTS